MSSDATIETTPGQSADAAAKQAKPRENVTDMSNILQHIKGLETSNTDLAAKLLEAEARAKKMSAKTEAGMRSALDTLMTKWMDAVDTKDVKVKDGFRDGLEKLVKNSAEDNGVWQMMVAASSLHERQVHDLDQLRVENSDLKTRVDGIYADHGSRVVGGKGKADQELSRADVPAESRETLWDDFAKQIGSVY